MRVAYVLVQNLAVQLLLSEKPDLRGRPVIIGGLSFETKPVIDASPEAVAYGIKPGMSLREAQSLCPEAVCFQNDETRYWQTFESVADILENFSPIVELEGLGCACIDITGIQNEQYLAGKVISALAYHTGLNVRVGVAGGKFFAKVAAMTSKTGLVTVVSPGEEAKFITPFSIDFIDCPTEVRERLMLLGIRFIGQLRDFPKEALSSQFGDDGIRLFQLSHGIDLLLLIPGKRAETVSLAYELEPPAEGWGAIEAACQYIIDKLFPDITYQGKVCHNVSARFQLISGLRIEKKLSLKEGNRSERDILSRIRTSLETAAFAEPIAEVELSFGIMAETGRKLQLWQQHGQPLGKLAADLRRRFGYQPLKKVTEVDPDTIVPERRFGLSDIPD